MRVSRKRWLVACLFGLVLLSAGPAGAKDAAPWPDGLDRIEDARIDRPINVKQGKTSLSSLLATIGKAAGVTLTASREVADQPVVVWVKGQPARAVMVQVARLFHYTWSRSGAAGDHRYRLFQDTRSTQELHQQLQQDRQWMWIALQSAMTKELADPKSSVPRPVLQFVSSLGTEHWSRLMESKPLYFSTSGQPHTLPLPEAEGQRLYPREPAYAEAAKNLKGFHLGIWCDLPGNYRPLKLTVRRVAVRAPGEPAGNVDLGSWSITVDYRQPKPKLPTAQETAERWSADPVLKNSGRLQLAGVPNTPGATTFRQSALYPALAESFDLNLVADAYWLTGEVSPQVRQSGELPLYELLRRYVQPNAAWERDGAFLRCRSHTWYQDQQVEIPASTLRQWATHLRQTRKLSLDDAARLALSLRDEQLDYFDLILRDEGVGCDTFYICMNEAGREILRLYGTLAPAQQQAVLRGEVIPYEQMPERARGWLQAAYEVRQKLYPFHAPPGGPTWGTVTMLVSRIAREVSDANENRLIVQFRILDGPNAGKQIYGGPIGAKYADPASTVGAETQSFELLHVYDETHRAPFRYPLPTFFSFSPAPTPGTNDTMN